MMKMSEESIVYIGRKPLINYCMAVIESLRDSDTVTLKARGSAISRAVDVAEVTKNRYLKHLEVEDIEIGTEELEDREGGIRNVSRMSIVLKNNG